MIVELGAASPGQVSLVPAPLATAIIFSFQMSAVWPQQLHQSWGGLICVCGLFSSYVDTVKMPKKNKSSQIP